jgi:ParB family chromosome partitioning protein
MLDLLAGLIDKIDVRKVAPPKHPIRRELTGLEELVDSISKVGILQPIIVRSVGGRFEVVAGHRRLEACKRLRLTSIPCHIVEMDDKEAFEASLVENLQRETVNPIEEARAFQAYVSEHKWGSVSELARTIGKSQAYVSKRLGLLRLPLEVQEQIIRRRISPSVAEELSTLSPDQQVQLAQTAAENHLTRRDIRDSVKSLREPKGESLRVGSFWLDVTKVQQDKEVLTKKLIDKAIVALRVAMYRLDDINRSLEDSILREMIVEQRYVLHSQINALMKIKRNCKTILF